ncbi:MAG TPA: hypothetical protein VNB30_01525 [Rhizomicrobium sp.]|nr:hypothetical protein [Rhizomicrobium sp.]
MAFELAKKNVWRAMTMPRPGPTTTYEAIDLAAAPRATGDRAQQEVVAQSGDDRGARETRWSLRSTLLLILGVGVAFWGAVLWLLLG